MLEKLNGKTRLYMTVGYPIGQVRSPADITHEFEARGMDAVQVPIEIRPNGIGNFFTALESANNVDGMVITVPYKFVGANICKTLTPRASLLGAANIIRRNSDAVLKTGSTINGKRALLIGAGGAGSAIGLALLDEGIGDLGIYDIDPNRSDKLMNLLASNYDSVSVVKNTAPQGFDIIAHATPVGMKSVDPLPLDVNQLIHTMHVGDVVTEPAIPPLIKKARERGCRTNTGIEMFDGHRETVVDFLLHQDKR